MRKSIAPRVHGLSLHKPCAPRELAGSSTRRTNSCTATTPKTKPGARVRRVGASQRTSHPAARRVPYSVSSGIGATLALLSSLANAPDFRACCARSRAASLARWAARRRSRSRAFSSAVTGRFAAGPARLAGYAGVAASARGGAGRWRLCHPSRPPPGSLAREALACESSRAKPAAVQAPPPWRAKPPRRRGQPRVAGKVLVAFERHHRRRAAFGDDGDSFAGPCPRRRFVRRRGRRARRAQLAAFSWLNWRGGLGQGHRRGENLRLLSSSEGTKQTPRRHDAYRNPQASPT